MLYEVITLDLVPGPDGSPGQGAGHHRAEPFHGERTVDGEPRITSYNVCYTKLLRIPLVIPPVMNNTGTPDMYDIAVRQFQQQILPGGIWNALGLTTQTHPATTIWSYGPTADPLPDASLIPGLGALPAGVAPAANSQFNYPAYTIETMSNVPVSVRWRNELKPNFGAGPGWLEHLLPIVV